MENLEIEVIFLNILNRSINAGWLILAVILLRFLLKKAPAWISCLLWAITAVRLACPFSPESIFSLIPGRETIPGEIALSPMPSVSSGLPFPDSTVNPALQSSLSPNPACSGNPLQIWLLPAGILWAAGVLALLLYALIGYIRLIIKLRTAVRLQDAIYLSEFIDTPFLLGLVRPRIYLPSPMPEEMYAPVIAHEQAHLKRLDHLWKILGYLLLAVYWFHPLCWAAYALLCRDLELACDQKVIRDYEPDRKKQYAEALLACSLRQRGIPICPLSFGEVNVKKRIRSVLHYQKPALPVILAAIVLCAATAVCFLTDPASDPEPTTKDFSENGNPPQRETQPASPAANTSPELLVNQWTRAFVSRNGNHIAAMASEEVRSDLADRELLSGPEGQRSFGSPGPWPPDTESGYSVCSIDSNQAQINYYAWTQEPHVTVWREILSYELRDGEYLVTGETLLYLDDISSLEEFTMAYGNPTALDGSGVSYLNTGAWKNLNQSIRPDPAVLFPELYEPEPAARKLLNLSDDPDKVRVERLDGEAEDTVRLQILFAGDPTAVKISMTRPSGGGVWIPVDFRTDSPYRLSPLD